MKPAWSELRHNARALSHGRSLLAILGVTLCIASQSGRAQDVSKQYFHVQHVTTGCQSPAAVRLLTNPNETAQADARRLRSIRNSGHCVTITPRSQWSYLWRENDVAMMSYGGTVGHPGSYYLKVEELIDANGQHPGGLDTDAYSAAGNPGSGSDAVGAAPLANAPTKTTDVPTIVPATTPPSAPAAAPLAKSIDELIGKAGTALPSFNPPPGETPPTDLTGFDNDIWLPALSLAVFVGALSGFAALRRRKRRSEKYQSALEIALDEIRAQALALREAKAASMRPDRYGTFHPDGWEREKATFIGSRISLRLRDAGYENLLPTLLLAMDTEIDRQANSRVEPVFDGNDPIPNRADVDAIDVDLSNYAHRCASLLQNAGWTTDPSPAAYNRAVDIFAERDGRRLLLQCKGGGAPVGVEAVQQVFTLKDRRQADIAAIITQAPFTRAAQQMASAAGVHALHDDDLIGLIQ